jgi:biofilm PGA synthesis N-glycosyltransferase PgaC
VAPFGDSTVGAVCGAKLIARGDRRLGESEGLYWKYESFIKRQETRVGCCTAVAGEIFAIRRNLFESPPSHIINDDFYMAMRLIQRGYCVVYAPKARSYERVSLSAQDEIARRARIVAGRFQAMGMARKILTLCTPLIVWQIVSHKFLRPLVPLFMIGALVTNVLCVVMPPSGAERSYVQLTAPINWILLILQTLFYASAVIGNHFQCSGDLGRLLYLPTFLFNSNLAALAGLYRFLARHQTTLWQRVQRRDSQSEDAMRWLSGLPHSQIEK